MSTTNEKEKLELKLLEVATQLTNLPSSINELLQLLNRVGSLLSRISQSPTESIQHALSPLLKSVIVDTLLRHGDVDVKVAVASCISEILRITAPEAPYDDDQMKEIFRLIISSFENLHDELSLSYTKRTSILKIVSEFKFSTIMLDLECDDLILEMIQHFLKTIRDHHPERIFSFMKTVMVIVLEESEEISLDLLSPILESVKKDNKEVLPIARRLGESVLESCATILRPYLKQVVNTLGISLDDYSDVLVSICQDTYRSLEQNDVFPTKDHMVDRENSQEVALPQLDSYVVDESSKLVISNDITQVGEDHALVDPKSLQNHDDIDYPVQSKGMNLLSNEEPNDLDIEKVGNSEQKQEQLTKKIGRKPNSSNLLEHSKSSNPTNEKKTERIVHSTKSLKKSSDKNKDEMLNPKECGEKLVGTRVKVWWPMDEMFYEGVVSYFYPPRNLHKIVYDDGEEEYVNLKEEIWKIIKNANTLNKDEGTCHICHASSVDLSPKKRRKTSANKYKSEEASSSKPKRVSLNSSKYKDYEIDVSTSKTSTKSKQETLKTMKSKKEASRIVLSSKAKYNKSCGNYNNIDRNSKVKTNLLRTKDLGNEGSKYFMKEVEETKGKTSSSSKVGSETKNGKKHKRN